MRRRSLVLIVPLALVLAPSLAGAGGAKTAGSLQLNGVLAVDSRRDAQCPPGAPPGLLCPARTGAGVVPGLGRVTETYAFLVEEAPPTCPAGSSRVLGYPVRWVVQGKGELHFALAERPECSALAFTVSQSFAVTGGTGVYSGASGAGTVDRRLVQTDTGARGPETWTGTLSVPGLEFDLVAPVIGGASAKTVRAPRKATRVAVRYSVSASDAADGAVPVTCRPASGTRFRIGRTVVRCTAEDRSGNVATAAFRVTVKRR